MVPICCDGVDDSNIAARNNTAKKYCIVPQQLTKRVGMQKNEVIVVFF